MYNNKVFLWDLPPVETYVKLKKAFAKQLFSKSVSKLGTMKNLSTKLNSVSWRYGLKRRYSHANISTWINGTHKSHGKIFEVIIPL